MATENKDSSANARGIPKAPFISLDGLAEDEVDNSLAKYQEAIAKYKFMEQSTLKRAAGIRDKLPDIEKTLDMVRYLASEKDNDPSTTLMTTQFEMVETLYVKASIRPTRKVSLWLGANVMVEYPVEEAIELLTSKLKAAQETYSSCEEDLEYLREQITTMEVNTARVYNYGITQRKTREGSNTKVS